MVVPLVVVVPLVLLLLELLLLLPLVLLLLLPLLLLFAGEADGVDDFFLLERLRGALSDEVGLNSDESDDVGPIDSTATGATAIG